MKFLSYKLQGTNNCLNLLSFTCFSSFLCLEFVSSRRRVRFTESNCYVILLLRFGLTGGKMTSSQLYNGKKSFIFRPSFTSKGRWLRFPDVLHYLYFWGGGCGFVGWFCGGVLLLGIFGGFGLFGFFFIVLYLKNSILCIWYFKFSRCRSCKNTGAW